MSRFSHLPAPIRRLGRWVLGSPKAFYQAWVPLALRGLPKRLHLGCGPIRAEGWTNVDIVLTPATDVLDDVRALRRFPAGFAEGIYACHVLEHVAHDEVEPILRAWRRVLKPGGELRISVPDVDRIVDIYKRNWQHFQTPGNSPWNGLIWGGQTNPYDFHMTGFNFCWLKFLLERNGFEAVQTYPHEPHFLGLKDGSLANEPFGEFISLNVQARRAEG